MADDERQASDLIRIALCSAALTSVEAWDAGWTFRFSNNATVTTQSVWRALTDVGIAVTSEDHRQQFGLPEPVDARQRAEAILLGKVMKAEAAPITGDLRISFGSGGVLELLNTSSGYEGWHLAAREDGQTAWELVALGGGDLAMWSSG
jgi:hypothetical protein